MIFPLLDYNYCSQKIVEKCSLESCHVLTKDREKYAKKLYNLVEIEKKEKEFAKIKRYDIEVAWD